MSGYAFVTEVNSVLVGDSLTQKNCYDLWDVLFKFDHVKALLHDLKQSDVSAWALCDVIQHIANRTLLYGKPFEFITREDYSRVDHSSGVYSLGISTRTVTRCLEVLIKEKLVIVFWDYTLRCRGVGLDFYNIVVRLYGILKKCKVCTMQRLTLAKSILKELIRSKGFVSVSKSMQGLCGDSMPRNTALIPEKLRSMGITGSQIARLVGERASSFKEKRDAKATERMATSNLGEKVTTSSARAFLINWKNLIADSGLYPHYGKDNDLETNQVLGCVASFLKAEYAAGKSPSDVMKDAEFVINSWAKVPEKRRKATATSKNGKPYNVSLKATMDFMFLYNNYSTVKQLCNEFGAKPTSVPAQDFANHNEEDASGHEAAFTL